MFDEKIALEMAAKGYSKQLIAAKLGCAYSTVSSVVKKVKKSPMRATVSLLHSKLGSRISEILVEKNLTVKQLCFRSGLHASVVSRILTGSQDVRLSEIQRIAKALNVDIKLLL